MTMVGEVDLARAILTNLFDAAAELNTASDALTTSILRVESELKKVSSGVQTWVEIDEDYELGNAKIGGIWGLAIREREPGKESWRFCEAPRKARVRAVPKILNLLERMVVVAREMTRDVSQATKFAEALADNMKAEEE